MIFNAPALDGQGMGNPIQPHDVQAGEISLEQFDDGSVFAQPLPAGEFRSESGPGGDGGPDTDLVPAMEADRAGRRGVTAGLIFCDAGLGLSDIQGEQ